MAEPEVKQELAAELQRARAAFASNFDALRHDLDFGARFRKSFHDNKGAYIGGATVFGLLLSKLPTRKKKIYVERKGSKSVREAEKAGLFLVVLQFLFKTFRPMLMSLLTKGVTDYVKSRAAAPENERPG